MVGFATIDVSLEDQILPGDTQLIVELARDSDYAGDTMAANLVCYGARTLEG